MRQSRHIYKKKEYNPTLWKVIKKWYYRIDRFIFPKNVSLSKLRWEMHQKEFDRLLEEYIKTDWR